MGSDLIHQLLYRDNWDAVEMCMEVFDDMPVTMRIIVGFKMAGDMNKEVAEKMCITESNVSTQLWLAKKRICRALTGRFKEDIT